MAFAAAIPSPTATGSAATGEYVLVDHAVVANGVGAGEGGVTSTSLVAAHRKFMVEHGEKIESALNMAIYLFPVSESGYREQLLASLVDVFSLYR